MTSDDDFPDPFAEYGEYGEPPRPAPPVAPLSAAVATGDYRTSLVAIRDHLAERLHQCKYPKDAAPLARELRECLAEIEKIPAANAEDGVDEFTAERARRRAAGLAASGT